MKRLLLFLVLVTLTGGCTTAQVLDQVQKVDQKFYETMKLDVAVDQQSALLWQKTEDSRYSLEKSVVDADINRFLDTFDESGRLVAVDANGNKVPISKAEVKRIFAERDKRFAECLLHHNTNGTAITNFNNSVASRNAILDTWYSNKMSWTDKQKEFVFATNALIQSLVSAGSAVGIAAMAGGL